jgi:hypothetical protein
MLAGGHDNDNKFSISRKKFTYYGSAKEFEQSQGVTAVTKEVETAAGAS